MKVGLLFSWGRNFDVDTSDRALKIIIQIGEREYHIDPSPETIQTLKNVNKQIRNFMNQEITVEGEVLEIWEKQLVTETTTVEKWVRVQ